MAEKWYVVHCNTGSEDTVKGYIIAQMKMDKGKIQVLVEIFGRATPIDLDFNQVEKI